MDSDEYQYDDQDIEDMAMIWNDDSCANDTDVDITLAVIFENTQRCPRLFRKRWDSEYLRDLSIQENSFVTEYRVDPGGFDILVDLLRESLTKNSAMASLNSAKCGSALISDDSRLGAALIVLGGGRNLEAMRTLGLAKTTSYDNLHNVVNAINIHPALAIQCDNSIWALKQRALEFKEKSRHGLFQYCTGSIDGLSIPIRTPRRVQGDGTVIANTRRFFDGKGGYQAINVQAVSDANCEVMVLTANHVGCTFDGDAFESSSLKEVCIQQSFPHHWVGDTAYMVSQWLLVPFAGNNLHVVDPPKEWVNYYHSQVRITSERTNGIFIRRWGVFWKPLEFDLKHIINIIHACFRLHNFKSISSCFACS